MQATKLKEIDKTMKYGFYSKFKHLRICRSGFSYKDQFTFGKFSEKSLMPLSDRNVYSQCIDGMQGMWSEWSQGDFNSCSKPCGGGKILKYRICRYPPCDGSAFEDTEEDCNEQKCIPQVDYDNCFHGNGFMYRGCISSSFVYLDRSKRSNCIPWSRIANHTTEAFPGYGLDGNECRNPDNRAAPYCYTKYEKNKIEWEYCDVPRCEVNQTQIAAMPSSYLQLKVLD